LGLAGRRCEICELDRKFIGGLGKSVFWIVMTKQAGKEYDENVSSYSKYFRQYIKADEFNETERKIILGVSLGNEK
jgi:hypothetical protein